MSKHVASTAARCHDRSRGEERRMMADRPGPMDRTERLMRQLTWETYGVHPDDIFPPLPRGEMACEQVMNGMLSLAEDDPFGAMMGKYDDPSYIDVEDEP